MGSDVSLASERLVAAMTGAYPEYVSGCLAELGIAVAGPIAAAVALGGEQLAEALEELLTLPAESQTQSPLELVREATRPVSAVMASLGVRPPPRDTWEIEKHPEDRFGLFPASSRDLGDEVWRLHLQWGIDKAQAVAGVVPAGQKASRPPRVPAVALFGVPMGDRARLVAAVESLGYRALIWRNPGALVTEGAHRPIMVVVDLRHPEAHHAIKRLAANDTRSIATAAYVDDLMAPGLMALGAEGVIESGELIDRLGDLLPRIA